MLLTEYQNTESFALLNQIVEDEYDSYSEKNQQEIEALLGNLAEIIGEVKTVRATVGKDLPRKKTCAEPYKVRALWRQPLCQRLHARAKESSRLDF